VNKIDKSIVDESIFVKCDCTCNVLELNATKFGNGPLEFSVALWVSPHSGNRPMSKKERIRWCKYVMKTGKPWADYTIVRKKDALRIANFINKHTNNNGK
jgi:hypothetical protein